MAQTAFGAISRHRIAEFFGGGETQADGGLFGPALTRLNRDAVCNPARTAFGDSHKLRAFPQRFNVQIKPRGAYARPHGGERSLERRFLLPYAHGTRGDVYAPGDWADRFVFETLLYPSEEPSSRPLDPLSNKIDP